MHDHANFLCCSYQKSNLIWTPQKRKVLHKTKRESKPIHIEVVINLFWQLIQNFLSESSSTVTLVDVFRQIFLTLITALFYSFLRKLTGSENRRENEACRPLIIQLHQDAKCWHRVCASVCVFVSIAGVGGMHRIQETFFLVVRANLGGR